MQPENLILLIVLLFMFGFMFLQNKRRKAAGDALVASLKVGVTVMTTSGLVGEVISLDDTKVVIKSAGSTVEFMRGAIRSVDAAKPVSKPATKATTSKASSAKPASKPATKSAPKTSVKKTAAK